MPHGVVRGEVCRDEEDAGRRGEQRGEACRWRCGRGAALGGSLGVPLPGLGGEFGSGVLGGRTPYDARVKEALILEVYAGGDEHLGEVLWPEITLAEGNCEARPERVAGDAECW